MDEDTKTGASQAGQVLLDEKADAALKEIVDRAFAAQGMPMIVPRHLIDTVAEGMKPVLRERVPEARKEEFRQQGLKVIPGSKPKIDK
ncbi:MAG: hypothetical protein HYS17_02145 [Micavibrio aeruginosavorus]|uniref:Uncharacterized protein n=1 Tax=Micavibrio aeruginosavorus TaxID=349221 RepID=A0A7T5UI39_9BACT|nr:MAG: hypothetical protein HYS17_02145 [Micavibrio aeruginosavorus]